MVTRCHNTYYNAGASLTRYSLLIIRLYVSHGYSLSTVFPLISFFHRYSLLLSKCCFTVLVTHYHPLYIYVSYSNHSNDLSLIIVAFDPFLLGLLHGLVMYWTLFRHLGTRYHLFSNVSLGATVFSISFIGTAAVSPLYNTSVVD